MSMSEYRFSTLWVGFVAFVLTATAVQIVRKFLVRSWSELMRWLRVTNGENQTSDTHCVNVNHGAVCPGNPSVDIAQEGGQYESYIEAGFPPYKTNVARSIPAFAEMTRWAANYDSVRIDANFCLQGNGQFLVTRILGQGS